LISLELGLSWMGGWWLCFDW